MFDRQITSPDDPALDTLCARLRALAPSLDAPGAWPSEQLKLCGEAGVFEWFVAPEHGGQGWSEADVLRGYVKLAAACLTTAFVITQRTGAMNRIAAGDSDFAREALLANLMAGRSFATVGISHLTTSRQHVRPVLRAEEDGDSFDLDGFSPWVTGVLYAQNVVVGATMADGRQVLIALPTDLPGVRLGPAAELVGLAASCTGPLHCDRVRVDRQWLLAGPVNEVMKQGLGARTGGSQTSALAIGLASAAIEFLHEQSVDRRDLLEPAEALVSERDALLDAMLELADDPTPTRRASEGSTPTRRASEGSTPTRRASEGSTPTRSASEGSTPTRSASEGVSGAPGTPQTAFPTAPFVTNRCVANSNELRQRANSLALRASQAALAAAKGAGYVSGHPAGRWCREALFFLVWSCPAPVLQANLCELAGLTD